MTAKGTAPDVCDVEGRSDQVGAGSPLSVVPDPDRQAEADDLFRDCFAVLVRGKACRRHLYFNLPAAERAVRRATSRGDVASMTLVRLVPVGGGRDA